jgi:hypothetical protein
MRTHKLRTRLAGAVTLGAAGLLATMTLGVTAASAGTPADPSLQVAPSFNNGTVNAIRGSGSDTTFFLMQQISDLYTSAGLYGCTLNSATGQGLFNDANNGTSPYASTAEEFFCQGANLDVGNINATSGSPTITLFAGNFPSSLAAGQTVNTASQSPAGLFTSPTTILSTTGTPITSVTLSTNANATTTSGSPGNLSFVTGKSANTPTTDAVDNWSDTEVAQGVDAVGSGAGQKQLCNNLSAPLPVDFARSSKPIISTGSGGCATEEELGYAKDGVPIVEFPTINPSTFGTSSFSDSTTHVNYAAVNGGNIGPVAAGWLPGDPVNGSANNGTALTANGSPALGISNTDNGGGLGSTAYRLWCASLPSRITDWGQLTNIGPKLELVDVTTSTGSNSVSLSAGAPEGTTFPASITGGTAVSGPGIPGGTTVTTNGSSTLTLSNNATAPSTTATLTFTIASALGSGQGIPFGLPVRIVGLNPNSGTEATFASYAQSGSAGACAANMNTNAANDPNSGTAASGNPQHIALENNASQISLFAQSDFPSDNVDQAVEAATSLYIESNGVVNTNPHAGNVVVGASTFSAVKINEVSENYTTPHMLNNILPTARTLFNIVRTDTVRASTAGFLNWICDSQSAITKGTDNTTGVNFDAELTTLINTQFGFVRLNDNSAGPSNGGTPGDNLAAPNTTCAVSQIGVNISGTTLTLSSGTFPAAFANGATITGDGIVTSPATTIVSGAGTNTLTISQAVLASSTSGTVSVPGQPAIQTVPSANLNK